MSKQTCPLPGTLGKLSQTLFVTLSFSLILVLLSGCTHPLLTNPSAPDTVLNVQLQVRVQQVITSAITLDDPVLRCHCLETLGAWNEIDTHPLIRRYLTDTVPAVRYSAAIACGDVRDYTARPILTNLLQDENISVKLAAGYALEKMGDDRFGAWFDSVLFGSDEQFACQACLLLGKLGNTKSRMNSQAKLWELLKKKNLIAPVRLQTAEALAMLKDEKVIENLLAYASSGYADDRMIAISGLSHLRHMPEAYAMLTVLAEDTQIEVQLAAIRALGNTATEKDIQTVLSGLEYISADNDPASTLRVRGLALLALGSLNRNEDSGRLYQAMLANDSYLRVIAARATVDYLININKPAFIPPTP